MQTQLTRPQHGSHFEEPDSIGTPAKILVVEDDENILNLLSAYLQSGGHDVVVHQDGVRGMKTALSEKFDICILDVMLPHKSGIEIADAMRQNGSTTPVLFLTARGTEADVLSGFAAGADDYVIKPFSPRELMVRIDAILRRSADRAVDDAGTLEFGPIRLHAQHPNCELSGSTVALTPYEHKILLRFLEHPSRVFSRAQLIALLYGNDTAVGPKAIDVHVHNLRAKLGDNRGKMIETVRGFGYRLSARPEPAHQ